MTGITKLNCSSEHIFYVTVVHLFIQVIAAKKKKIRFYPPGSAIYPAGERAGTGLSPNNQTQRKRHTDINPCSTPDFALLSIRREYFRLYWRGDRREARMLWMHLMVYTPHHRCARIFHCWRFCHLLPCDWCSRSRSDQRGPCGLCRHIIYHHTSRSDCQPNVISIAEPEMGEHSISGTLAHRLQCADQRYRFKSIIHSSYVLLLWILASL